MTNDNLTESNPPFMSRLVHSTRSVLAWLTLAVVGTLALLVMLITPGAQRRRSIGRWTSRAVLAVAGVRLVVTVNGAKTGREGQAAVERALSSGSIIVANHTSYLDGVILTAALPPHFVFVIKKEMSRVPLAGLLLRQLGSEFVDRFDRQRGAMDARRVLKRASSGQALLFFPEGTFSKEPGLMRFHSGAFVTAVRAGFPVVPIVIRGARKALPHDRIISTPGVIEIEILDAVQADPSDSKAAVHLRDQVRGKMLARLGEPDLAAIAPAKPVSPQTDYNALPPRHQDLR